MKIAILAGGAGTRFSEETDTRPKPMAEIGGKPILWYTMMHFARYGRQEFAIALGYKDENIGEWLTEYATLWGDMTVNTGSRVTTRHVESRQNWLVDFVHTGMKCNI